MVLWKSLNADRVAAVLRSMLLKQPAPVPPKPKKPTLVAAG